MRCYQEYTPKDIVVIAEQGKECPKYQRVIEEIEEGMKIPEIDKESPSREIKSEWKNATIRVLEDGNKIIYIGERLFPPERRKCKRDDIYNTSTAPIHRDADLECQATMVLGRD